ncbi:MAG: hypothetical protein WA726_08890 [Acidimicrobiia bacterium]
MSRLPRFEEYRFIGTRDDMRFYDCDDPDQFAALEGRVETSDLVERNGLQSFAPDTTVEAMNRSFRSAQR